MNTQYACPFCQTELAIEADSLHCASCDRCYPYKDGLPDFSTRSHYWNQLTSDQMEVLLEIAEEHGYEYAVEKILGTFGNRYLVGYVLDQKRADFRAVLPLTQEAKVLDLGGGWGAVACSLAPHCQSITTLDTNPYNLRFIRLRAKQSGLTNVNTARIDPLDDARLPFPDNSFDLVVINGVLEYVGSATKGMSVTEVQRRCLAEVRRVLKPGGQLYLGIENRYSYLYFLGTQDHSDVRYTSLLPRPLASLVTRIKRGKPYRTYTYSYAGYKSLLASAGFETPELYLAYPSYREPRFILPSNNARAIAYFVRRHASYIRHPAVRRLVSTAFHVLPLTISSRLIRMTFDSFLMVAGAHK